MNYKKLILGILIIGLAIWLLLGLLRFGSIIAFFWIFEIIVNELTLAAGLNKYLAMIIAFVPALALLWSVPLMFSLNKRKRNLGMIMGGACYLLYSILMFSLESNHYFDPATGAPTKCYASGLTSYDEVPCNTEFHPQTGNPVIKDPAQIKSIIMAKHTAEAQLQPVSRVAPSSDMRFFTPDGKPLYWYYQHPNGEIEIFDTPGKHPQLNVELNSITAEIAAAIIYPGEHPLSTMIKVAIPPKTDGQKEDPNNPMVKLRNHLQNVQGQLR